MAADLHTHTTASDGRLSPDELIRLARARGLTAIGVTDHDTVAGLDEALAAGKCYGVTVVPGVELSTEWEDREIHILGYYLEWQEENLLAFLETMRRARYRRITRMVSRLRELGYDITLGEVEGEVRGEAVGRPHIAAALVRRGYAPSVEVAFKSLLARGRPAYVPRAKVEPARAVEVILKAGGVPVLAHPGLSRADALIPALVESGLQGVEVYYPVHDAAATGRYLELASRYELVVTGGSDFHGIIDAGHADLGTCRVGPVELEYLLRRAEKIKAQATKV
ncbi:PHP domain-containing protein [Moorella sulfitireducens (nom. illeg.)]|uniref:PHP domain-containing protein n=1 Tax=Neomoorella sulfitireducens TaxID=2972948 RepID=UPI0021ACAC18|nr:PHP domain-containing protein [Moorella sulfitireducens]